MASRTVLRCYLPKPSARHPARRESAAQRHKTFSVRAQKEFCNENYVKIANENKTINKSEITNIIDAAYLKFKEDSVGNIAVAVTGVSPRILERNRKRVGAAEEQLEMCKKSKVADMENGTKELQRAKYSYRKNLNKIIKKTKDGQ